MLWLAMRPAKEALLPIARKIENFRERQPRVQTIIRQQKA